MISVAVMNALEKVLQEAINWLASEHKFFVELKRDLAQLKKDLDEAKTKQEVRDIKHCFRDFHYLGVSEARFSQREQLIEHALHELVERRITITASLREIEELSRRLHTEAANLIRSSSLYEGKIRDFLIHLQKEIRDQDREQAQALLMELGILLEHAEEWIAALSADLERAKRLLRELEEEKDPNLEDLSKEDTRIALAAMLTEQGWTGVRHWHHVDGSQYDLTGVLQGQILEITFFPGKKRIVVKFSQPRSTHQWAQSTFTIVYEILQQRARHQTFRNFLTILLPEVYKASMPMIKGPGFGSGYKLPGLIREALGT